MKRAIFFFILLFVASGQTPAQQIVTPNFRTVVEKRLKGKYKMDLATVCAIDTDAVARRVFRDYGAIYVSNTGGMVSTY